MANEKPTLKKLVKLAWVAFHPPGARVHSNAQLTGAITADGEHEIWLADHAGAHVIAIESKLYPSPARIPLSACAGYGE